MIFYRAYADMFLEAGLMKKFIATLRKMFFSPTHAEPEVDAAVMFAEVLVVDSLKTLEKVEVEANIVRCNTIMITAVERQRGCVVKAIGEDLLAHFPTADAAIDAAVEIQTKITNGRIIKHHDLEVRIGIGYGPITVQSGDVFGRPVKVAAEMCGAAKPSQIVSSIRFLDNLPFDWQSKARNFPFQRNGNMAGFAVCEIFWRDQTDQAL